MNLSVHGVTFFQLLVLCFKHLANIDREPIGTTIQKVRRFEPQSRVQNGPQNRVQNGPQNRVQNGKIDIQSWVLIPPFSTNFGPRNSREMAMRPTKKADL